MGWLRRAGLGLLLLGGLGLTAAAGYKHGWIWPVRPDPDHFPVRGLDVSRHQGPIRWPEVADEGWRFVWIKATEGGDWTDPRFDENRAGAAAAGLDWGAYHYFTFCRPPADQAAHFLATLGDDPGALPPAVDVELGGNCKTLPPPAQVRADVDTFLALIEAGLGRPAVLYLIGTQLPRLFGELGPPDRALWQRNMYQAPGPLPWRIWQWHSRGWVAGVDAWTDLNVFNGDEAAYQAWRGAR